MAVGVVAALLSLALGELVAAFFQPRPGPVIAVANRVIEYAPNWFIELGKSLFQLSDKPALIVGTVLLTVVFAAALNSRFSTKRWLVVFFAIALLSIGSDPQAGWIFAIAMSLFVCGVASACLSLGNAMVRSVAAGEAASSESEDVAKRPAETVPPLSRRGFLTFLGGGVVLAGLSAIGANAARGLRAVDEKRRQLFLSVPKNPEVQTAVDEVVASGINQTPNLTPYVVPADDFYLIDTALIKPQVDVDNWSLSIKGLVNQEMSYTYAELLERSTTIAPVTLSCVSNPVGGELVGNAVWQGIPLSELLDEAGVLPEAEQLASRSVDGWTCGFPIERAFDGRTALLAVGMNGEPLTIDHGFPARLVVSGLYGYVSATKWISEIDITTWNGFDGYWIPRGWSKLGPVKLQSRIDTPRSGSLVRVGETVPVAGVAWAPNTGVAKVEVSINSGPWEEAELGDVPDSTSASPNASVDTWVQWRYDWSASEQGQILVQVRATDVNGDTQTSELADVAPDGATGWHTITVRA